MATEPPPQPRPEPRPHHTTEAEEVEPKARRQKSSIWKKLLKTIIILLILGAFAYLVYGYIDTKNKLTKANSSKPASQNASEELVDKVGRLVVLPSNETPAIATVENASKLKDQLFFANSKDGDKVLIYSKSSRAVLYRPSTNQVVEYSKYANLTNKPTQ